MSRRAERESTGAPTYVAVDTGGTFTDLVRVRDGEIRTLKVPSTPDDPAEAVFEGLRRILEPGEPFVLIHGSTVATNALLERKGARVALVTNQGFEDVIEIGRQDRPQLYALVGHRPPPLVPRELRVGIAGRLGPVGEELAPLDREELASLPDRMRELGAEAVAVSLLHSYTRTHHEDQVRDALGDEVPVSVSSRVLREFREYERTSTTVVNAYVQPKMTRYLGRIEEESEARRFRVMGSNGGALSGRRAIETPVDTILSGPAGGVVGALAWGRRAGFERVISFDMGGTSTDVSLCPGRPLTTRELAIDRQPIAIPVLDIHTVGAGGGSIARVDPAGGLRVGPRSAGADPGPICYGQGGKEVTVTDAHVWLGRLPFDAFLGGDVTLDRDRIAEPLGRLGEALGLPPEAAAEGVLEVAESAMERALRVVSVERGYDPADFVLVAFGGAGGLHAAGLAQRLGTRAALVPPSPGVLSAYGMLVAPVVRHAARTLLLSTADPDLDEALAAALQTLSDEATGALRADGAAEEEIAVEAFVDARYRGQSHELRVPAARWIEAFHDLHEERYGYTRREVPVEAVTARVEASVPGVDPAPRPVGRPDPEAEAAEGSVIGGGVRVDVPRFARAGLGEGTHLPGPAIVTEYGSTTWVPPGWRLSVDHWGSLLLEEE